MKKLLLTTLLISLLCAACSDNDNSFTTFGPCITPDGKLEIHDIVNISYAYNPAKEIPVLSGTLRIRSNLDGIILRKMSLSSDGWLWLDCSDYEDQLPLRPASEVYVFHTISDPDVRIGMIDLSFVGNDNRTSSIVFSDETSTSQGSYFSDILVYASDAVRVSNDVVSLNLRKGWNILVRHMKSPKPGLITANDLPSDGRWIVRQ